MLARGRQGKVSQYRARDSTLLREGPGSLVISLLGFVGPSPGATSFCFSISSLLVGPPGSLPLRLRPTCLGEAEGPRAFASSKLLAALENEKQNLSILCTSLLWAPKPSVNSMAGLGELPRAAGRVEFSSSSTGGLAVFPVPGLPVHLVLPLGYQLH